MNQYFEMANDASIQVQNVNSEWMVTIDAVTRCRCEHGAEHEIRLGATRTFDYHASWVDSAMLSAFEGALRGSQEAARMLFMLMLQDEMSSSWVDPCGPLHPV